ncbi:MAG: hypothetical protein GIKADHBN_03025 [Phycisphaerales bacterium]|nr:hypothetical protein [Phycisphaerales bacterium]
MQIGQDALEPLVTDPPVACPQLVLSSFGPRLQSDRTRSFVPVGTFASLPLFCEASGRSRGKFRPRSLGRIAERLLRLLPHASYGLRVILVDPPSAVSVLDELMDLESAFDDNQPVPIHAAVLRTRLNEDSTDEEEVEVASLVRELTDHGGSLSVLPAVKGLDAAAKEVEDFRPHLTVVFDPGEGEAVSVGLSHPPSLSPLVVPRAYRYDAFDDRLDVVIAGNAEPFATYHTMLCRSIGVPRTDFIGRRSGASQSLRQLEAISRRSLWTVVVDQGVEPTFRLGSTRQLDVQSESGRDIVTFTSHPETVEDLIADAIRQAGMVPDPDSVARVLRDLFQLNGQAVLALARAKPGGSLADPRIAKGILGVLTASRWYTERYPDALIISLDDPLSQRWILGVNADDRHGDLVGVRPSESGIVLEAIEVKTHDDPSTPYSLNKGIVNGKAAVQIDQTLRSLKAIFAEPPSSPVIAARRDILRDQLYRAVASRPYRPEQRARFVGVLDELFSKGPGEFAGVICRVRNTSGGERDWPESGLPARTGDGNAVKIAELAEGTSAVVLGSSKTKASTQSREAKVGGDEVTVAVNGTDPDQAAGGSPGMMPSAVKEPAESIDTDTRVPTPTRASGAARVRVLVGTTDSGREIYWDPQLPENPLNNFGVLITGDPGSGKTQMIRAMLAEACNRSLPVCVFDFKNDYTDTDDGPNGPDRFASRHGLVVHDIDKSGLPFNPLALLADAKGECQPIRQVHELASILRRVFSLGDQQEARLKQAMSACYEAKGIRPGNRVVVSTIKQTPSFSDVKEHLEHDDKNEALLNRLSPLFDLGLFPSSKSAATTFDAMMQTRVVLDLHSLPDDRIKAAMSEFIIVRLHGLILRGSQPRELRRLLVFDEAWRVKDSVRLQELAREGRAFGVGIVVGTQFPGDIPENLAGNLATQLLLANQDPDHQRVVVRTLCGTGAGSEAARLQRQVAVLQKHQGFFRNQQMAPFCLVTTLPYWRRVPSGNA